MHGKENETCEGQQIKSTAIIKEKMQKIEPHRSWNGKRGENSYNVPFKK